MIYFDNAATTWPKPGSVITAVSDSMKYLAANPGRSGHKMAIASGEKVFECRELIASHFGLDNPCNVIFTLNATHALNIVIGGILNDGDHVVCTAMDHNSSLRPLYNSNKNIEISVADANKEGKISADTIKNLIKSNTRLVIMSHVSNVCGTIQDIKPIGEICKKQGIAFLVDASQSAGILDINMARDNIDFLAFPGHKGLYGPMGTGVLCINSQIKLTPIVFGGTGSNSHEFSQPLDLPDRFESGTVNFPGICGLEAGIRFVESVGENNILNHELRLADYLINGVSEINGFKIVGKKTTHERCGVVSVVHNDIPSAQVAEYLDSTYNIATRALYHCAYPSHLSLGTHDSGTLRISFGIFNTIGQVKTLLYALEHI